MRSYLNSAFHGTADYRGFMEGMQTAINNIDSNGAFAGDNLFTYGRNLSFLDDKPFMEAFERHTEDHIEKSLVWRMYTLAWAAKRSLKLEGDIVECGCYKGTSARVLCDYLEVGSLDKRYYLYDLFEHSDYVAGMTNAAHGPGLFDTVKARFEDVANVVVTKGRVPDVLAEIAPERIAFLHLDLNDAASELGALKSLFDRIAPGASIVLDDYGWLGYRTQKEIEDRFFGERGYQVLELPTGQGLVIK